jgi:hypothetical protein
MLRRKRELADERLKLVAIGRLAIGRARIRRLEIDELVVRRLRITEQLQTPDTHAVQSPPATSLVKRDDASSER